MPLSQPAKRAATRRISVHEMQHCIADCWAEVNYLAFDRLDIHCAASILGTRAPCPKEADMVKAHGEWGGSCSGDRPHGHTTGESDHIMVYTDSDWAADWEDRRSTSGGMLVHNGGLVKFWSRRQKALCTVVVGTRTPTLR